MTTGKALHDFYNQFMTAYPTTSVPEDAVLPYLTYEVKESFFEDNVNSTVELWYHTASEAVPNKMAHDIAESIGQGGLFLPIDDGAIWLKRGTPWMINVIDQADNMLKRRQLNVTMEFVTNI